MKLYKHQIKFLDQLPIPGYEGIYEIDSKGTIYCILQDRYHKPCVMKPFVNNSGYLRIALRNSKHEVKKYYIHRLVAQIFISNPNEYKYVDHKNCNKLDNSIDNLEWVTQKENIKRTLQKGLQNQYFCIVDGVQYLSMSEASEKIFNKNWLIKELRYKYGNEFIYDGHSIKVVM